MHTEANMPHVLKNIQKSSTEAVVLERTIARVFENLIRANSELDDMQGSRISRTHGLATELQNKLENLRANEVHTLVEAFGSIYNQLVSKIFQKDQIFFFFFGGGIDQKTSKAPMNSFL